MDDHRCAEQYREAVDALRSASAHEYGWRAKVRAALEALGIDPPAAGSRRERDNA